MGTVSCLHSLHFILDLVCDRCHPWLASLEPTLERAPRNPGVSLGLFAVGRSSLLACVSHSHLAVVASGTSENDHELGSFPDPCPATLMP